MAFLVYLVLFDYEEINKNCRAASINIFAQ